jgi:hypothetical protein
MPWRHIIFTDTGVVYPADWGMPVQQELPATASLTARTPQTPSERSATQNLDANPESPAASSLSRANECAALPVETLPYFALRTEREQDPLLQSSSGAAPRNGCRSPLATRDRPAALATGGHSPLATRGRRSPWTVLPSKMGVPTTSPVN